MKDYYKVLAVPRHATAAQIKDAYRRLIKACHPDVNSSPRAAEWTRELNEAYGTLENAEAKASYDRGLKPERSAKREAGARPATVRPKSGKQTPPENKPREDPRFRCQRCFRRDSTLRISIFRRVFSFVTGARRFSATEILCNRCRVQESLAASAFTVLFGWWSAAGFFWTFEALEENARGGSQSKAENVAFLKSLGDKLHRSGHLQEAYQALAGAFKLRPEPAIGVALNRLAHRVRPIGRRPFWHRLWRLELNPEFYHVFTGVFAVAVLILAVNAFRSGRQLLPFRPVGKTGLGTESIHTSRLEPPRNPTRHNSLARVPARSDYEE